MDRHLTELRRVRTLIESKLRAGGGHTSIPLLKDGAFTATLAHDGVIVDKLSNQPLLPWLAFEEAVRCMQRNGGRASRGDAMQSRLGDHGLLIDTIEGHVAHVVYGKQSGQNT